MHIFAIQETGRLNMAFDICTYNQNLQFLRCSMGLSKEFPSLTEAEWKDLYSFCIKQSLVGIAFSGMERLNGEQKPPYVLLMQWIAYAEQIERGNRVLNEKSTELQSLFMGAGFGTCILKGQGNALMYPNSLRRQSGDIDIWVHGKTKDIIAFLKTKCDLSQKVVGYHHVEFPIWDDVEVEVHWRPSWRSSPLHNYRIQRWFRLHSSESCVKEGLIIPTWRFNVVYQLQHMFFHVLQEGLGLRQAMDYYYLLRSEDRVEEMSFEKTLKWLGLYPFAGAMMYVLKEVFCLDERYLIAPVNEKKGKFLLTEIMQSGNFGKLDERNAELQKTTGVKRSLARAKRSLRFLKEYPVEVLCTPFQIYHVIWRKLKLWKFE